VTSSQILPDIGSGERLIVCHAPAPASAHIYVPQSIHCKIMLKDRSIFITLAVRSRHRRKRIRVPLNLHINDITMQRPSETTIIQALSGFCATRRRDCLLCAALSFMLYHFLRVKTCPQNSNMTFAMCSHISGRESLRASRRTNHSLQAALILTTASTVDHFVRSQPLHFAPRTVRRVTTTRLVHIER
jgi:hypothetical protein